MSSATLSDLITRTRQASDMVGYTVVSDAEVTNYINGGLTELYDILVHSYEDYFLKKSNISIVSGQSDYFLPQDFYKLAKLFAIYDSDRYILRKIILDQLDYLSESSISSGQDVRYLSYYLRGNQICFAPTPSSTGTVEMWYVPQVTRLEYAGDVVHINIPVAWDEYIVADAAAKCLAKEETDPMFQLAQKKSIMDRIKSYARERDSAEADVVWDYYGRLI